MINLSFSEKELEAMKEYFQSELSKAEQKVFEIRNILGKIEDKYAKPGKKNSSIEKVAKKKGRPAKNKPEIKNVEKKKRGRKPKIALESILEKIEIPVVVKGKPGRKKKDASAPVTIKEVIKTDKKETPRAKAKTKAPKPVKAKKIKAVKEPKVKTARVKVPKVTATKPEKKVKEKATPKSSKVKKEKTKKPATTQKFPIADWILDVLVNSPQMNIMNILDAIKFKQNLGDEEVIRITPNVEKQLSKMLKTNKIISNEEGGELKYGKK